jgi:hypothetical protein
MYFINVSYLPITLVNCVKIDILILQVFMIFVLDVHQIVYNAMESPIHALNA